MRRPGRARSPASTAALLANRSFGGAQVSRTFYARGQTGQQLLLGAYQALERQVGLGAVKMFPRHEMQELVVIDGKARGIVARDLETGAIESYAADAVILATGGYGTVFYLATYAKGCNATAIWRAYKKGAAFANPCYTQIHPTCIPVTGEHQSKLTLMSESLRNDGRIWVPKKKGDTRPPGQIPEDERDYYLERKYPSFGNLAPRDIASRAAKEVCDEGRGVGKTGLGVYLDFADAIKRLGVGTIRERYGNLFDMYERITDENPYKVPMRIYPAIHYTMGGLWVDYNLMSTIPGLFVLGEANFSDHGANRLGASALMQGLADGYFIIPYTLGNYLASTKLDKVGTDHPAFKSAEAWVADRHEGSCWASRASGRSTTSTASSARSCGTTAAWPATSRGSRRPSRRSPRCARSSGRTSASWATATRSTSRSRRPAASPTSSSSASCSASTPWSAASRAAATSARSTRPRTARPLRDDEHFCHVAAWEYTGEGNRPNRLVEPLDVRERPPADAELQVSAVAVAVLPDSAGASRRSPTCERSHCHCTATERTIHGRQWHGTEAQPDPERLAAEEPQRRPGRFVTYRGPRHQHGHVVPRDARRGQRGADPQGRGADRLRPRLPRGHLRPVRRRDQRRRRTARGGPPRPASSTCGASTTATS